MVCSVSVNAWNCQCFALSVSTIFYFHLVAMFPVLFLSGLCMCHSSRDPFTFSGSANNKRPSPVTHLWKSKAKAILTLCGFTRMNEWMCNAGRVCVCFGLTSQPEQMNSAAGFNFAKHRISTTRFGIHWNSLNENSLNGLLRPKHISNLIENFVLLGSLQSVQISIYRSETCLLISINWYFDFSKFGVWVRW